MKLSFFNKILSCKYEEYLKYEFEKIFIHSLNNYLNS